MFTLGTHALQYITIIIIIIIIELVTVTIKGTRSIVISVRISLFPSISREPCPWPRFSVCGCHEHSGVLDGGVLGRM